MTQETNLGRGIRRLLDLDKPTPFPGILASVTAVDLVEYTIDVDLINDDAGIDSVRLVADGPSGCILIPKVGSVVVVSLIAEGAAVVTMFSEIEKVFFKSNDAFNINGSVINLNGEILGGIAKIEVLKLALNALQTEIDTLMAASIAAYTAQSAVDGGLGLAAYNLAAQLIPIEISQIENDKVKHGIG